MDRKHIASQTSIQAPGRWQQQADDGRPIKVGQAIATTPRQQGAFVVADPPTQLNLPVGPSPFSPTVNIHYIQVTFQFY